NEMVDEAIASQVTSNRFAAVPPVMPHDPFARTSDDEFVAEAAAQKLAVIGKQKEDIARLLSLHRAHEEAMSELIESELSSLSDGRDALKKMLKIANMLEIASRTLVRLITIEGRVHKIDYAAEAKKLEPAQARVAVVAWKPRE
ncbi:hypothetical protein, partial [Kaistia terrae]